MHQLILLRHAKAANEVPGTSDHDRPLTEGGRRSATLIGQAMRKAGLAPDVVLVSSALRTQQTFEVLEATGLWDEWPNMDTLPALYMASRTQIREILRELQETVRSVLVIGHNPGLHELALSLAGKIIANPELARLSEGYPTASFVEFLITPPWRRLDTGAATLQRFLRPTDIT
jgi:phosphohistidine phosphatase